MPISSKKQNNQIIHASGYVMSKQRIFTWLYFLNPSIKFLSKLEGRVLDVGCGGGETTRTLARKLPNLKFYGVDILPDAIKVAKSYPSEISFKVADAEKLPFKDEYFSAVVSFEVLEHVEDPFKMLREVNRILKKGGIFYFTTPLEGDTHTLYYYANKLFKYNVHEKMYGHINHFSNKQIHRMLSQQGFSIINRWFCAHYINQAYNIFINTFLTDSLKSRWISFMNVPISVISGIESVILRKSTGLDVQIICRKK